MIKISFLFWAPFPICHHFWTVTIENKNIHVLSAKKQICKPGFVTLIFFTFFIPKVAMKMQNKKVTGAWRLSWIMWFSAREGEKGPGSGVPCRLIAFPSTKLVTSKSHLEQVPQDRALCCPGVGLRLPDEWRQCQHAGWKEQFRRNLMKLAERDGALSITALLSILLNLQSNSSLGCFSQLGCLSQKKMTAVSFDKVVCSDYK